MNETQKLTFAIVALTVLCALGIGCAGTSTVPQESVGLVISGPANDGGWNASGLLGLNELKAGGAATAMTEDADSRADQIDALETYAKSGYTYVIAHGGEFTDALEDVAPRYPNVRFLQSNGWKFGANWRSLSVRGDDIGYILGYMAGLTSFSGKVGLILQKDELAEIIEAAIHGLRDANVEATLTVAKTDDFDVPAEGQAAAETLLAAGVDSMVVLVDGAYPGVHTAVKDIPNFRTFRLGALADIPVGSPEVMGGVVLHMGGLFRDGIAAYKNGEPTSVETLGFKEDALAMSSFSPSYPESARVKVLEAVQKIINGTIVP